jgi:drug/metabolite transporter (DMT)-like permease
VSETHLPRRILRSIGALLAGVLAIVVLSVGTDVLMNAIGIFPLPGQPMGDGLLMLATAYRTVYGIAGSYIAARLAPYRHMSHALALGVIGLVLSILGAVATWNKGPAYGHAWYPLALVALAVPNAWAGGKLYEKQMMRS